MTYSARVVKEGLTLQARTYGPNYSPGLAVELAQPLKSLSPLDDLAYSFGGEVYIDMAGPGVV